MLCSPRVNSIYNTDGIISMVNVTAAIIDFFISGYFSLSGRGDDKIKKSRFCFKTGIFYISMFSRLQLLYQYLLNNGAVKCNVVALY
jgi:hypothetical protein